MCSSDLVRGDERCAEDAFVDEAQRIVLIQGPGPVEHVSRDHSEDQTVVGRPPGPQRGPSAARPLLCEHRNVGILSRDGAGCTRDAGGDDGDAGQDRCAGKKSAHHVYGEGGRTNLTARAHAVQACAWWWLRVGRRTLSATLGSAVVSREADSG